VLHGQAPLTPGRTRRFADGEEDVSSKPSDSYREELLSIQQPRSRWNKMASPTDQLLDLPRARAYYEKASKVNHRYSEAINNSARLLRPEGL